MDYFLKNSMLDSENSQLDGLRDSDSPRSRSSSREPSMEYGSPYNNNEERVRTLDLDYKESDNENNV